jgi:hypothetical protein
MPPLESHRRIDDGEEAFVREAARCQVPAVITALDLSKKGKGIISTGIARLDGLLRGGFSCGSVRLVFRDQSKGNIHLLWSDVS